MPFAKPLKLYLDTTIPSYVFAFDAPARMQSTKEFLKLRYRPGYQMVISEVVLWEIDRAPRSKKTQLSDTVEGLAILPMTTEADRLAMMYIKNKALPASSLDDARHVALATLNRCDALVSWNFDHLVNIRRSKGINETNDALGFPMIEIVTPDEVL